MFKKGLSIVISLALNAFLIFTAKAQVTPPAAYSNGTLVNYVRTWDANAPEQDPNALMGRPLKDVKQTTTYFDGIGRPLQIVFKQGSMVSGGNPVDMITPVVYDPIGREQYKYLPFASTAN